MAQPGPSFGSDRRGALLATQHFAKGTIGYGVHRGINFLYNGVPGFGGGYRNRYSAEIGSFFQRSDIQELLSKPITDAAANRQVAQAEYNYWMTVGSSPNSSAEDREGAALALRFSPEKRAQQHILLESDSLANTLKAIALIAVAYPGIIADGVQNIFNNILDDTSQYITDLESAITRMIDNFVLSQTIRSPLALDLDGNGIVDTINKSLGIHFDLDGNTFAETTGWIASGDGLLVLDRNGNGEIDNGFELFGDNTVLANGAKAANGFLALAELDANADGRIDALDEAYNQLQIWKDSNSNGIVNQGELLTLSQASVQSLSTAFISQSFIDAEGNHHLQVGGYMLTDGSSRVMNDVWFAIDTARTIQLDLVEIPDNVKALPELQGFGNVRGLHQAIARDTSGSLQALLQEFIQTEDAARLDQITTNLLYAWVGVENEDPSGRDSTHIRTHLIDARKVYVLEAFLGQSFVGTWCDGSQDLNPHANSAPVLEKIFDNLMQYMKTQLLGQTHFLGFNSSFGVQKNGDSGRSEIDVSKTISLLSEIYTRNTDYGDGWILEFGNSLKTVGVIGQLIIPALRKQGDITGSDLSFALATIGYNLNRGTDDDDNIEGISEQNNYLFGASGNDVLTGSGRSDVFVGGLGNDKLSGGSGDDVYLFERGDGKDIIIDIDSTDGNFDRIQFGKDILADDVSLIRSGSDLILRLKGTSDKLIIQNWGAEDSSDDARIERFEFADGTSWDPSHLPTPATFGTADADLLVGSTDGERLSGFGGDDHLSGQGGHDTLDGGSGDDELYGGFGNDALLGRSGNDILWGAGGNDTIIGGQGADRSHGGDGADRFIFNSPDEGGDTIIDFLSNQGDRLALSAIGFGGGLTAGTAVDPGQFVVGTAATNDHHRLIYNTLTGLLLFDPDGSQALAPIQIATLNSKPTLAATDILVFS
ncbi:MAG: calcium-binding protein [Cyanobacteriota bacterium]